MNALTQEKLPVPQDAILFEERGAKGGVNVREIETELPPSHYANISNLYLDDSGGLCLRKGYVEHSQLPAGAVSGAFGRGLGRFRASDGTSYLIAAYWIDDVGPAIEIAYYDENLASWTPIPFAGAITPSVDSYYRFLMVNDLLIMMNGLDRPLCWDGNTAIPHNIVYLGHQPASVAPTLANAAGGGQDTGWHWYILAFVNQTYGFVSSGIVSATSAQTNGNKSIDVTVPNQPTDPDVTHIRLYRSLVQVAATPQPPLSQFYFVSDTAIVLPLPQIINDGVNDAAIMANQTFLSDFPSGLQDHDLPPNMMSRACVHKSRLFSICENAGDQSVAFFSRPEWPAYHPPTNNFEIDPGSGSNLRQLGGLEGGVLLLKDDRAGCLDTFGDPANWEYRPVSKNGIVAPNSLKIIQDPISGKMVGIRIALDGFYMTDGNVDLDIGRQVWPLLAEHGINMLQAFSAYHEKRENLYIIEGVYYYNTAGSGGAGGGGPGGSGWWKPGWPPGVYMDPALQSGFIFHLNQPIYDERGRFSGFAATSTTTHFMVHLDRLVPEDTHYYGILYPDVGAGDNRKIFKIWSGSEDDGEDIQFIAVTRKVSPNDKLTPVRFKNIFVRNQSLSALFGLTYSIDYGKVSGIFENLSAFLSDTFLDINIYDLMPALTFNSNFNGAPGLAAGQYYYRYRLGDAATPAASTTMTESSDIGGPFNCPGGAMDGIKLNVPQLTDPWLETANDKGYTHFLIYRTLVDAPIDSTYYFLDNKAIGAAGTFNDQGQPQNPLETIGDSSAEIVWTMPTMRNIRLPRRGGLKAGAKGEFIQLIFSGLTDDPYLKFIAFGLLAKPKILR